MAAFVRINRSFGRHCARIPDGAAIINIVILSVGIQRDGVVTISGNTQQFGILIEAVPAAGIGDQSKEVLTAELVDPR